MFCEGPAAPFGPAWPVIAAKDARITKQIIISWKLNEQLSTATAFAATATEPAPSEGHWAGDPAGGCQRGRGSLECKGGQVAELCPRLGIKHAAGERAMQNT